MRDLVGPLVEHIPGNLRLVFVECRRHAFDNRHRFDGQLGAEVFKIERHLGRSACNDVAGGLDKKVGAQRNLKRRNAASLPVMHALVVVAKCFSHRFNAAMRFENRLRRKVFSTHGVKCSNKRGVNQQPVYAR